MNIVSHTDKRWRDLTTVCGEFIDTITSALGERGRFGSKRPIQIRLTQASGKMFFSFQYPSAHRQ